jgi:tryptophan synthase alpha chain
MTRLGERFESLRSGGRKAFVAFVTAGDPSLARTIEIAVKLDGAGVDVLELGVPFSDPLADGPAIQRSSERALKRGVTLVGVLDAVRQIRKRSEIPLLLFSYFNPLLRYGLDRLSAEARDSGVDGVLVTDLPPEEGQAWKDTAWKAGLDTVFLAAPTSPPERLRRIVESSRGFVYAVSRIGITGERKSLSEEAAPLVERIRSIAPVPVALGFGISTPGQVAEAARVADGVVVGSRLVRFLEEQPEGDLASHVRWLKSGISNR